VPTLHFYKDNGYIRGHQAANNDRSRVVLSYNPDPITGQKYNIYRDQDQTFLTTNILPEANQITAWEQLEKDLKNFVKNSGREAYIITGRNGENNRSFQSKPRNNPDGSTYTFDINVPDEVWKVVLIPKNIGQGSSDVDNQAIAFGILMNNINHNNERNWKGSNGSGVSGTFSIDEIEGLTGLDFFSEIPLELQNQLESRDDSNQIPLFSTASLLAESVNVFGSRLMISAPSNVADKSVFSSPRVATISPREVNVNQDSHVETDIAKIRAIDTALGQVTVGHDSSSEVNTNTTRLIETGSSQIGIAEIRQLNSTFGQHNADSSSSFQVSFVEGASIQNSSTQISSTQITPAEATATQVNPRQIDSLQVNIAEVKSLNASKIFVTSPISFDVNSGKVSLSSGVTAQQFILSDFKHFNPSLLTSVYSTAQSIWHTNTSIDLNFEITHLPTGQLAEATITGYDQLGRPNTATISIDDDANGVGWFLDTTPQDNSEFTGVDNYLQATPNSPASGKYDLLTTILHEMGHTLGIINGYSEFDKYVKGRQFITDTFTANLTPDGSHLDTTFHPYDLMNTSLKPGVRKLPSTLNLAMIDAINAGIGNRESGVAGIITAPLTAGALLAINNGDFSTTADWNTAGATNIINGTATLTEQSQKLSELTQAFIIPTGAKTLQFTIKDNHLIPGDTSKTANDAFEVALLDSNTFNPLAGTSIGLTNTDSLLNIQANGTIHKSDKVTITALTNNSSIVTIDLTQVTPSTQATLYFNLLGFGAKTSTVTIDDVKLFTDTQSIPVTNNDTLTLDQNTPLTLTTTQLTTNDTNVSQIQIINQPTHGTLTQTPDGKFTYQPVSTYVGNDSVTYLGFGSDGQISNLATVNLTVNNLPPTIQTVTIPTKINEGQNIQLSATAKDGGSSDNLTYTWNLGDGTNPITGQNITHTYTDNGNYQVTLTVTDKDGGTTNQTTQIKVDNVAPTATITTPIPASTSA
jgi:DNA/RNA endonuclease G (NUC1)